MDKLKSFMERANRWLNDTTPFNRAIVAFGGMIGLSLLVTVVANLIKALIFNL